MCVKSGRDSIPITLYWGMYAVRPMPQKEYQNATNTLFQMP